MRKSSTGFDQFYLPVCSAASSKVITTRSHCYQGSSVSSALMKKRFSGTGKTELTSCSPTKNPCSLANTHTFCLFLVAAPSFRKTHYTLSSHMTQKCSLPSSRKRFLPNSQLLSFLSILFRYDVIDHLLSSPILTKMLQGQS